MTITRTLATGLIGLAASGLFTAGSAVALATLNASPVAVHCHTLEGCTEGELHHADHRARTTSPRGAPSRARARALSQHTAPTSCRGPCVLVPLLTHTH